jgi:hypothetical protein
MQELILVAPLAWRASLRYTVGLLYLPISGTVQRQRPLTILDHQSREELHVRYYGSYRRFRSFLPRSTLESYRYSKMVVL